MPQYGGQVIGEHRHWLAVMLCLAGLALLMAAGKFIVLGTQGLQYGEGWSPLSSAKWWSPSASPRGDPRV